MVAWVAIIISTLALLVNVVSQREKLLSAIDEYRMWRMQNTKRKQELKQLDKLINNSNSDYKNRPLFTNLVAIYAPLFFLSVISSSFLSIFEKQTVFYNQISLNASTYIFISSVSIIVFLSIYRKLTWMYFLALFFVVLIFSLIWGTLLALFLYIGADIIWGGSIAGFLMVISMWLTSDNTRSRKK